MTNFGSNFETPETGVELDWGRPGTKWHKDVKGLFTSFKENEFSKFFYQTDVHMIRLLCEQHNLALLNPDTTAAGWKAIYEQWGKFGTTMKDRAQVRFVIAKTQVAEDYSYTLTDVIEDAFNGED
jgi:hypothetical protein